MFSCCLALLKIVGEVKDGILRIGNTMVPVYTPEMKLKVPDVLFYENAQVMMCNCVPMLLCVM